MFRTIVVIATLAHLTGAIDSWSRFDFVQVWSQHTNQILHIYDQLSRFEHSEPVAEWNATRVCRNSIQHLVQDAKEGQFYANKMIDSIGRPTSGILEGRLTYLGRYDECIASTGTSFSGKYCIAHIRLPHNFSNIISNISGISSSLYKNIPVKLGVCLPSTCSTEVVSIIAHKFFSTFKPALEVKVVECMETNGVTEEKFDSLSLAIFGGVCGVILVLIVVGTFFEYTYLRSKCTQSHLILNPKSLEANNNYKRSGVNSLHKQILLAFSIKENLNKIFDVKKSTHDSIAIFHGIKFLATIWIIFLHSISFSSVWINFNNPLDVKRRSHSVLNQVIANGTFSVDCFFFISGFLVTHLLLKKLRSSGKRLNLWAFYLHRYLRMTPTMMVVIGFGATMLRYFGSGPEWANSTAMYDSWCRKNWWLNMLYLHNFVDLNSMCLSHSWYSAVDIQFYLISPLLILLLHKKPVCGIVVCGTLLLGSVATTWALTILKNYPAVPYHNDIIPREILNSYYQNIYIKPYCRIGPYLVGMLLAYYMLNNSKNVQISKPYLFAGWAFTIVCTLGVIVAMLPANNGHIPDVHIAAAYSATSRIFWSLGLSWITYTSVHRYGGLVHSFLSLKLWVPLSRLTYCAFLVHPVIIAIFYGSRHQTFDYSFYLIFYFTISNICITYMVSLLMALFVEYPLSSIGKILLKKS